MISRIWKEEKNTVIGLFISVLAGMLLITTIWKNDYTEDIPFGILDEDRSSLSQSIVKQFGINPSLDIVYYADSEQDLKQAILDKKIEAGVMIPENFSRDMSLKKSPQAVIFAFFQWRQFHANCVAARVAHRGRAIVIVIAGIEHLATFVFIARGHNDHFRYAAQVCLNPVIFLCGNFSLKPI